MGYTLWHYVIDSNDVAHRISRRVADAIYEDQIPPELPRREPGGILVIDIVLRLNSRIPQEVQWIYVVPILAAGAVPRPAKSLGLEIVSAIEPALKNDLTKAGASELPPLEKSALDTLRGRILAGEFADASYKPRKQRLRDAVAKL